MTRIVFSLGVRIPGEGMGNHGYQTALAFARHALLKRAFVMQYTGTALSQEQVRTFYFTERLAFRISRHTHINKNLLRDNLFDWWISRQIAREQATIFYGWNHIALWSLRQAKRQGMLTVLERANSHPLTYTRLLAEEYKKHGRTEAPYHPLLLKKHLKEIEETDYIAVTSEFTKQGLLEHGVAESRILFTPLGVDTDYFRPATLDAGIEKTDECFRVVYVGQLSLRKGVQYLLEAWSKLQLPQAELMLVGDVVSDLAAILAEHQRQTSSIRVCPHMSNPADAYHQADVCILPTLEDGFGLVVLEAMACGKPVIVTEHTGAKDCLRHELDGFIIPPYSADSIADTLNYCSTHRSTLATMGQRARSQAERYSWQRYQDGIAAHMRRIQP